MFNLEAHDNFIKSLKSKKRACPRCSNKLECTDIDYNFEGNYDRHWACDKCNYDFTEVVRYGKMQRFEYYKRGDY